MRFQGSEDDGQYTIEIGQYIVIPESQNPITVGIQRGIAVPVAQVFRMLPAIYFDD
jgi:hypothetical protein